MSSVSIFAEGTVEEQILELVEYIARTLPEIDRSVYIQSTQERLETAEGQKTLSEDEERKREILSWVLGEVRALGEGTEREIEGFFNLLFAHLLNSWPITSEETKRHTTALLHTIASSPGENATKYRILSNLFNSLPRTSALRLPVYKILLGLADAKDELSVLQLSHASVERWLDEWDISTAEKREFIQSLIVIHARANLSDDAYYYKLAYVRALDANSPAARAAALHALAAALSSASIFDFDALLKLDAVLAARDDPLFALLHVFLSGGLAELEAWRSANASALSRHGLAYDALARKIRLLMLSELAFNHVGVDIPYATIAATIHVDPSTVENWVIDTIRVGLLVGKLAQPTQTLRVLRAAPRAFGRAQWATLERRLAAVRGSLAAVLDAVADARRRNEHVAAALEAQVASAAVAETEKAAAAAAVAAQVDVAA